MRQQFRLRVIVPIAVLGLLGAGFGAYASRGPSAPDDTPIITHHVKPKPKPTKPTTRPTKPARSPLEQALAKHAVAVVLFYAPGRDVDSKAVQEARAGALNAHAGFLAVNVSQNKAVAALAQQYNVAESPTVLIFRRGPRLVARFDTFVDRGTIRQAVANAR